VGDKLSILCRRLNSQTGVGVTAQIVGNSDESLNSAFLSLPAHKSTDPCKSSPEDCSPRKTAYRYRFVFRTFPDASAETNDNIRIIIKGSKGTATYLFRDAEISYLNSWQPIVVSTRNDLGELKSLNVSLSPPDNVQPPRTRVDDWHADWIAISDEQNKCYRANKVGWIGDEAPDRKTTVDLILDNDDCIDQRWVKEPVQGRPEN